MKQTSKRRDNTSLPNDSNPPESSAALLRELVSHLRQNRTQLREEWARRITDAELLTARSKEEIFSEATSVDDNYGPVYLNAKAKAKRGGRLWRALAPPSSQKSKTPFNARSNRGNGGPG